jgi:hypothetical protein
MYSFGLWLPSLVKQLSHSGIQAIGLISALPFILATIAMYLNATWSAAWDKPYMVCGGAFADWR